LTPPSTPPPAQAALPATTPNFDTAINAATCSSPTCTWSVTVTNTGNAPGQASIHAQAIPGMTASVSTNLGVLQPGATSPPLSMTFTNPAPPPAPGQTTRVIVDYQVWVTSATLTGPDPAIAARLNSRGIDPIKGIPPVDPAYRPAVTAALDLMTRHAPVTDTTTTQNALAAITNAIKVGLLPEIKTIIDSGRLQNPQALATPLKDASVDTDPSRIDAQSGRLGRRREIEHLAEILRQDPSAVIVFDQEIEVDRVRYKADFLDTHNKIAYQLKTVTADGLIGSVRGTVTQLTGLGGAKFGNGIREAAPPGWRKVAVINIELGSKFYYWPASWLSTRLQKQQDQTKICLPDGGKAVDTLIITNGPGIHAWSDGEGTLPRDQLCK
jgi:hypothetical protein